jgi:hypothetical protein
MLQPLHQCLSTRPTQKHKLSPLCMPVTDKMSGRTCVKCRLHGKVEVLKGHKRNCPYTNCTCGRCTSHVDLLTHKNAVRDQQNDKGRLWRTSLLKRPSSTSTTTSTCTSTVQFPEMTVPEGQGENAMLAF